MILPASIEELSNELASRYAKGQLVGEVDLSRMNRVVRHTSHDMTATVEGGITLGSLQVHLAKSNQWLPLDPPGADTLTIRDVLDRDGNGPRRFGFGTARDWVIGMKFVLADGRVIESGGNVVKNVAGYDLHKLLIGANGELGVIAEVTFKVSPLPETEVFMEASFEDLDSIERVIDEIWNGATTPHVFDLYSNGGSTVCLVVGFCGTKVQTAFQLEQLTATHHWQTTDLDHARSVLAWRDADGLHKDSVAPSMVLDRLRGLRRAPFVVRAGNGVIYTNDQSGRSAPANRLSNALRELFDPKGLFKSPKEVAK